MEGKSIRLVIFDFDNTIVRLGVDWDMAKKEALDLGKGHGIHLDSSIHMMDISNVLWERPETKQPLFLIFDKHESECIQRNDYLVLQGMPGLIEELGRRYMLAIASANCVSTIERILEKIELRPHFKYIYGRDSVVRNKPSPEQIDSILSESGICKDETIFIGDSTYDENAAEAAKVRFFNICGHGQKVDELKRILLDASG